MTTPFFITGMPRARTAWLANFLTWGDAFCAHDLSMRCESVAQLAARIDALPGAFPGVSDSALCLIPDRIRAQWPDARWVVLRRDPAQVRFSLQAMGAYPGLAKVGPELAVEIVTRVEQGLASFTRDPRVLFVEYDDLNSMEKLHTIWQWCLRGRVPWCAERAAQLHRMKIEVIPERYEVDLVAVRSLFASAA